MKKIITLSLVIVMLALSACGNTEKNTDSENRESPLPTNNISDKNEPSNNTFDSKEENAKKTLEGVTTEKIEKMVYEIDAAKESGDKEKERELLDEMQKYLEAMEELAPENQQ